MFTISGLENRLAVRACTRAVPTAFASETRSPLIQHREGRVERAPIELGLNRIAQAVERAAARPERVGDLDPGAVGQHDFDRHG